MGVPNILDYLSWRGDVTMKAQGINEVDSVILARLSYIPFEGIVPGALDSMIPIGEAAGRFLEDNNAKKRVLWAEDVELLSALAESGRFRDIPLFGYVNRIDKETQTQFSAMTAKLEDGLCYTAFRGTDNTLVGWKEDFNMSFITPVPAQKSAVEYLERLAAALGEDFILGGHSKGGNLAVYGAAFAGEKTQKRVRAVYNFDGPGFDQRVLEAEGYKRISERVVTLVPQSSIVGMLLEHEERYTVVKSIRKAPLLQHDLYSWELERDRFVRLNKVTDSSKLLNRALKEWIARMDVEQREQFIDAVYQVMTATNAETIRELEDNWLENTKTVMNSLRGLEGSKKRIVVESLYLLAQSVKDSVLGGGAGG